LGLGDNAASLAAPRLPSTRRFPLLRAPPLHIGHCFKSVWEY